jgi:hypothetical protein
LKYQRQRTKSNDLAYELYLYFIGISYRNATKALCEIVHTSHILVWKWIQKYRSNKISTKRRKNFNGYIVDETRLNLLSIHMALGCNN